MAKTELNSILKLLTGKLTKGGTTTFRRTSSGKLSVYDQEQHSYESLHSPAQCLQRQNLALASSFAKAVLSDPTSTDYDYYNTLYIANCQKPNVRQFTSLRQFIIHIKYTELKESSGQA